MKSLNIQIEINNKNSKFLRDFYSSTETVYVANGIEFENKAAAKEWRKDHPNTNVEKVLRDKETKMVFETETFIAIWENEDVLG